MAVLKKSWIPVHMNPKKLILAAGVLWILLLSGCRVEESVINNPTKGSALMPDGDIAAATFVDLDFKSFPALPEDKIPPQKVIYVSLGGNDRSGTGAADSPFRSISRALRRSSAGDTIVIGGGRYAEVAEEGDHRGLIVAHRDITLMARPGESVELVPSDGGVNYGIHVLSGGFTLRGFTIRGFKVGVLFDDAVLEHDRKFVFCCC